MRVALAQFESDPGRLEANLERALSAVDDAADRDADLVVLPELFATGYFAFDSYDATAQPVGGAIHAAVRERAADHGLAVLAGTIVEDLAASAAAGVDVPAPEGLANTAVLFDADGERLATYRKHHLFGYDSRESALLTPGERLETATVAGLTVGMATCYDLRFPELFRDLLDAGVRLCCVPSAWPEPRGDHWELLCRARAVENQWFLAAANGVGRQGDTTLLGRSAVHDPWGTTVAGAADEPTLVAADLDPGRVERVREEFPAVADRRSEWI